MWIHYMNMEDGALFTLCIPAAIYVVTVRDKVANTICN